MDSENGTSNNLHPRPPSKKSQRKQNRRTTGNTRPPPRKKSTQSLARSKNRSSGASRESRPDGGTSTAAAPSAATIPAAAATTSETGARPTAGSSSSSSKRQELGLTRRSSEAIISKSNRASEVVNVAIGLNSIATFGSTPIEVPRKSQVLQVGSNRSPVKAAPTTHMPSAHPSVYHTLDASAPTVVKLADTQSLPSAVIIPAPPIRQPTPPVGKRSSSQAIEPRTSNPTSPDKQSVVVGGVVMKTSFTPSFQTPASRTIAAPAAVATTSTAAAAAAASTSGGQMVGRGMPRDGISLVVEHPTKRILVDVRRERLQRSIDAVKSSLTPPPRAPVTDDGQPA